MPRTTAWLATLTLLGTTASSAQQVYRWVDKQGQVHFTDDPEKLPEPQRSEALRHYRPPRQAKPSSSTPAGSRHLPRPGRRRLPPAPEPSSTADNGDTGAGQQPPSPGGDRWQQFRKDISDARQALEQRRAECKRLEEQRQATRRSALTFARPGDRTRLVSLERELEQCRQKLQQAQAELDRRRQAARREGAPRALWAD